MLTDIPTHKNASALLGGPSGQSAPDQNQFVQRALVVEGVFSEFDLRANQRRTACVFAYIAVFIVPAFSKVASKSTKLWLLHPCDVCKSVV
jgi:hypothetical protein